MTTDILAGAAIALAFVAVWKAHSLQSDNTQIRGRLTTILARVDQITTEFFTWTKKVEDIQEASNTVTGKTAESMQRMATDIQILKQDIARVQREGNPFPGVPGRK